MTTEKRSITPDQPIEAQPDTENPANKPAWFIALENLKAEVNAARKEALEAKAELLAELVKHEAKDVERHETQGERIGALEAKVGVLGLVGGALGSSATPHIIDMIARWLNG